MALDNLIRSQAGKRPIAQLMIGICPCASIERRAAPVRESRSWRSPDTILCYQSVVRPGKGKLLAAGMAAGDAA